MRQDSAVAQLIAEFRIIDPTYPPQFSPMLAKNA